MAALKMPSIMAALKMPISCKIISVFSTGIFSNNAVSTMNHYHRLSKTTSI